MHHYHHRAVGLRCGRFDSTDCRTRTVSTALFGGSCVSPSSCCLLSTEFRTGLPDLSSRDLCDWDRGACGGYSSPQLAAVESERGYEVAELDGAHDIRDAR